MAAPSVSHRLETHEEICAFRYLGLDARIKRVEAILIASFGAAFAACATIIVMLANIAAQVG